MTVIASSVATLQLLRTFTCPHCGAEFRRVIPEAGRAIECTNCLKRFTPAEQGAQKPRAKKRPRR